MSNLTTQFAEALSNAANSLSPDALAEVKAAFRDHGVTTLVRDAAREVDELRAENAELKTALAAPPKEPQGDIEIGGVSVPLWVLFQAERISDYMSNEVPGEWAIGKIRSR